MNDSIPILSVILNVYNCEKYIEECIESILNQTFSFFELIIINDGSTDKTGLVLSKYQSNKKIKIITRENLGIVASLNEAISLCNGEFIAKVDADDVCISNRFEKQISVLKNNDIDICGTWIEKFGVDGNKVVKYPEFNNQIYFGLFFENPIAQPSVMVRSHVFKKLRYKEAPNKLGEDYFLWVRAAIEGYKFYNIPEVLLRYRDHPGQSTKNYMGCLQSFIETSSFYSKSIGKEDVNSYFLENILNPKKYTLQKAIEKAIIYSKEYSISDRQRQEILEKIYDIQIKKNIFLYIIYLKYTNLKYINFRKEIKFFILAFFPLSKENNLYKFLLKKFGRLRYLLKY